ncbi:hypothetical protein PCL_04349 [Purpureocillium lilacinum]|uniref:Uncharacterized protein n=1 Tax=Purpureocillium lilacinum TaxID=33203 RepID=A0A2U3DY73_PURLI|nr:hypothetical protein Purlil1_5314 [Purpureocillium lilacinum]PWI67187.1 hypothetical protein PCL_04349 [Purpureocillium lilacinum]
MAEADAGGRAHMLDSRVGAADAVMDVASARRHGLSGAVPQHRVESQLKAGSPSLVTLPSRSYGAVGRDAGRAQEQRSPPNQGRDPLWAGPRKAPPIPQRRFRFLNCGRLEEATPQRQPDGRRAALNADRTFFCGLDPQRSLSGSAVVAVTSAPRDGAGGERREGAEEEVSISIRTAAGASRLNPNHAHLTLLLLSTPPIQPPPLIR